MRVSVLAVILLVASSTLAAADPASEQVTASARPQIALAVNPPLRWPDGEAIAASLYVGFGRHHAVRANVARYDDNHSLGAGIAELFFGGDGETGIRKGGNLDLGLSYVVFPRRLWSGLMLEAGPLVRRVNTHVEDEFRTPELVETHTTVIAGRAHIGWSWLMYDRVFISFAFGASYGYERGTETTSPRAYQSMLETHDVSRSATTAEGFVRIGGVLY